MLPRFLAEAIDPVARLATLGPDEARHLAIVLRLGHGDEIAVFDGAGREYRGRITHISKAAARIEILEEIAAAPESEVRLTLAQSVLKGTHMDAVVRDATMMGAVAIEPIVTAHTIARSGAGQERWRRIAIASAKQSRRAVVPAIGAGSSIDAWIARDTGERKLMLLEPTASAEGHTPAVLQGGARPASATLLVGPEGGWAPAEVAAALASGYVPITLGRRTFRADAVAAIALGILQFVWGDL
ncbi:MAG TPA: RsmE family RNA methyltransferase [Vicinamibacterales bacterium]|nr:RsmE family RNA methyltransferase [Vicinamibacterales bacterium]